MIAQSGVSLLSARCFIGHWPRSIYFDGYSFPIEMLFKCQQRGHTVERHPLFFGQPRSGAPSKISQREIYRAMYTVMRLSALGV